jgi:moderate conductance mechanosensitive channel
MQQFLQNGYKFVVSKIDLNLLLTTFLHCFILLVVGFMVLRLIDLGLKRVRSIVPHGELVRVKRVEQRAETLRYIVRSVGRTVLLVLVLLTIALDFGIIKDTTLLASASIIGLAIGFGAQNLVKDLLAGFFVLLEDQYGVGDTIRIGTQDGVVEDMSLRVTVLRNFEGQVHVIPNGTIQTVTVLTKDWSRAVIDIPVSNTEDIGHVFEVLARINEKLAKDMQDLVLEKPQILGIERLSEDSVTIRVAVKTPPAKQGDVLHEWRRRIKESLQKEGIEMPRRNPFMIADSR